MKTTALRNLVAGVVLVTISLLGTEMLLRGLGAFVRSVDAITAPPWRITPVSRNILDQEIGRRGNPDYWDHDALGYRNESPPDSPDVVAIGDSFTYGYGVSRDEAWPAVLGRINGKSVYNMGVDATGPMSYYSRFRDAMTLNPELIIVAFWFGNDLVWFGKRNVAAITDRLDSNLRQEVLNRERQQPFTAEWRVYESCGRAKYKNAENNVNIKSDADYGLRHWFSNHSRLYGLLRSSKNFLLQGPPARIEPLTPHEEFTNESSSIASEDYSICYPFSNGEIATVFYNGWRRRTLDDSDPRVTAGLEIMRLVIEAMQREARVSNTKLLVVLLPTKERTYWPHALNHGISHPAARAQLRFINDREQRYTDSIESVLHAHETRFVNFLSTFRTASQQVYFGSRDSHINAYGHEVVAEAIVPFLTAAMAKH